MHKRIRRRMSQIPVTKREHKRKALGQSDVGVPVTSVVEQRFFPLQDAWSTGGADTGLDDLVGFGEMRTGTGWGSESASRVRPR